MVCRWYNPPQLAFQMATSAKAGEESPDIRRFCSPQAITKPSVPSLSRDNPSTRLRVLDFAPPAAGKIGKGSG